MASESETSTTEMQSFLERLMSSRNRDLSLFIPFFLGFTGIDPSQIRPNPAQNSTDPDHNSENNSSTNDDDDHHERDRIILINPLTQGMVVIEGTGLDSLFRTAASKGGHPPAAKSAIEAMPSVEITEGGDDDDDGECVICLEKWVVGGVVKEMPCKHKFHGECIEKWLGIHGSCPVCRFKMPVEEEEEKEEGEERRRGQREIWVSFSLGSHRRRTEESTDDHNQMNQTVEDESQTGN